jgi:hypothetical protein
VTCAGMPRSGCCRKSASRRDCLTIGRREAVQEMI